MNTVTLDRPVNMPEVKRRLAKKVKRREWVVETAAFQRHRARVQKFLRVRNSGNTNLDQGIALVDDVFVFDRQGNRIIYPITPIDQLARFKKG